MKKRLAPSARFEAVPLAWSIAVTMLGWLTGCGTPAAPPEQQPPSAAERRFPGNMIEVPGQTQPVPSRVAKISPAVPATVTEVLVALGDRVKAGQLLVKLNEHKALAEVHCKQTIVAGAKASLATLTSGPPPSKLKMAELEARDAAAQGSLETAQARLKKYTLTAAIDGIVTSLEVHPGITADPGTSVWGEIIDLHQIDVRCELTPLQADGVTQRQRAEVIPRTQGHHAYRPRGLRRTRRGPRHGEGAGSCAIGQRRRTLPLPGGSQSQARGGTAKPSRPMIGRRGRQPTRPNPLAVPGEMR